MKLCTSMFRGRVFCRGAWLLLAATALLLWPSPNFAADTPELPPLTTVTGSPRLPGKFVWADLVTDDVPLAQRFYSGLFGWTFRNLGGYVIAANDERPLCGLFHRPRPQDPEAKPRWIGYISVSNVEQAKAAVTQAGGKVIVEPQKFPRRGEQAVFADPEGVLFGVIKSSSGDPADFLADPGDWIWIQLLSQDGRKAAEFYAAVAGYEVVENARTNRLSDYVLTSEGYARGTVRTIRSDDKNLRPLWLPFVRVRNVSESAAKATRLGGKVVIEPKPELFDGHVALITDPTGA
ncbi:MAG: VOC family protein, partial [Verrucomicrobia bacterium]|nr:VOC family protein [Verrucomicrobiota bacterium]